MIPLLLTPRLRTMGNRWRKARSLPRVLFRDAILISFSLGVAYTLFVATLRTCLYVQSQRETFLLSPFTPLALILLFLLSMLTLSSCANALGTLFFSRDMDLILAAPIRASQFYAAKIVDIFLGSSWMAIAFMVPVITGFGVAYNAPLNYYLYAFAALIPFFIIPAALSMIGVVLLAIVLPTNRTKELLVLCIALLVVILFFLVRMVIGLAHSKADINNLLYFISLLSVTNRIWSPAYWVAATLNQTLMKSPTSLFPYFGCLYAGSIAVCAAAYLVLTRFHYIAYSRARSVKHGLIIRSRDSNTRLRRWLKFIPDQARALLVKEVRGFTREMAQAAQLVVLLCISLIYLGNIRMFSAVDTLAPEMRAWWKVFLIIANLSMGSFIVTAIGTRFVFPSVSLEGQSFWLIQISPLGLKSYLRTKFLTWLVPVTTIGTILFSIGSSLVCSNNAIVVLNVITSLSLCYGIIGLAVGLGAFYADFSWDHPGQLAASFGSFIYMIASVALIAVNMVFQLYLVSFVEIWRITNSYSYYMGACTIFVLLFFLFLLNCAVAHRALIIGEKELERRME